MNECGGGSDLSGECKLRAVSFLVVGEKGGAGGEGGGGACKLRRRALVWRKTEPGAPAVTDTANSYRRRPLRTFATSSTSSLSATTRPRP